MNFEDLTTEQKEKAIACKTPEEMLELAKEEGIELFDDQIEAISGGSDWDLSGLRCQGFDRRRALL